MKLHTYRSTLYVGKDEAVSKEIEAVDEIQAARLLVDYFGLPKQDLVHLPYPGGIVTQLATGAFILTLPVTTTQEVAA